MGAWTSPKQPGFLLAKRDDNSFTSPNLATTRESSVPSKHIGRDIYSKIFRLWVICPRKNSKLKGQTGTLL